MAEESQNVVLNVELHDNDAEQRLARIDGAARKLGEGAGGPAASGVRTLEQELQRTSASSSVAERLLGLFSNQVGGVRPASEEAAQSLGAMASSGVSAVGELSGSLGTELVAAAGGVLGAFSALAVGGAAVVGGLYYLSNQAQANALALGQLSSATGETVPALDRLQFAFNAAGGKASDAEKLIYLLEQRMTSGGKSFTEALTQIGVSSSMWASMGWEERLVAISDGFRNAADGTDRAAIATKLLGEQGKEFLPMLMENIGALDEQARTYAQTTEEDAKRAKDFNAELQKTSAESDRLWNSLGMHVSIMQEVNLLWEKGKRNLAAFIVAEVDSWKATFTMNGYLSAAWGTLVGTIEKLPDTTRLAKDAIEQTKAAAAGLSFKPITLSAEELKNAERDLTKSAEESIRKHKEQEKAASSLAAVYRNVHSSVRDLSGAQIEAIRYYHNEGVAVGDIVKVLEVYPHQVEQVIAADKSHQKEVDATTKLFEKAHDLEMKIAGTPVWAPKQPEVIGYNKYLADTVALLQKARAEELQIAARGTQGLDSIGIKLSPKQMAGDMPKHLLDDFGKVIGQGIPNVILSALQGGGNVAASVAGTLGQKLGSNIVGMFGKSITSAVGPLIGGALNAAIPIIGSLAGPLVEKLIGIFKGIGGPSEAEVAGRDVAKQFENGLLNGLTTAQYKEAAGLDGLIDDTEKWKATVISVRDSYAAVGRPAEEAEAIVKRLWEATKQGPAAVKEVIDLIQETIAAGAKVADVEKQQAEAAVAASKARMSAAEDELGALFKQRDTLVAGIAKEAPEEAMGVIESQQRAQLAVLDAQIEQKGQAYADLAAETGQAMKDAIVQALQSIKVDPIHVPVVVDQPSGGGQSNEAPEYHNGVSYARPIVAHTGMASDEFLAKLQTGEGVLNRAATRMLGDGAIRSLNRGVVPAPLRGGGGGLNVSVGNLDVTVGDGMNERDVALQTGRAIVERLKKSGVRFR